MKKYKIIVRGGYGLTNFGDDALLKSIHNDYLNNFTNKELAYSSTYAKYLVNDIGDYKTVPLNGNYNKLTKILLFGGGTQFYSFYNKKPGLNKITSNLHLIFKPEGVRKIFKFITSKIYNNQEDLNDLDICIMALGIGVGPFLEGSNPDIEKQTKEIFKKMDFVAVRDQYSFEKCKEWGVKNFGLYADLCFKMEHKKFFKKSKKDNIEKIGVIVRDWDKTKEGDAYRISLLNTVKNLRRKNKKVHFIVFAKKKDLNWIEILKDYKEKIIVWDPDSTSIDSFFTQLSTFDLFITARYHGAIFSAMLGKPFVTIAIEQKLSMINKVFSESSYNWSYPFKSANLMESVEKIDSNYPQFSNNITKIALKQKEISERMHQDLKISIERALNK